MATQRWQPFRLAMVMTSTSRAIGSSVVPSNMALSLRKPSSRSGEVAMRATADGR